MAQKDNIAAFIKTILKRNKNTWSIIESKLNAGDTKELCWTVSLMCPLSKRRMNIPCRACDHPQCFDALTFLELALKNNKWKCPLCNKAIAVYDLQVDTQMLDILNSTSPTLEQVTFQADGSWQEKRKRAFTLEIVLTPEQPKKKRKLKVKSPPVITID